MLDSNKLARIKELSKKNKNGEITEAEIEERKFLHEEYLKVFRQGMKQQIEGIKIVDKKGNDLTSKKVKDIQKKKNNHS